MRCGNIYFMCVALFSLRVSSESLSEEDYRRSLHRSKRNDKDSIAISREIFRNITKQLRENIKKESGTDKAEHLLQNKVDDNRHYGPYQGFHHHEHHWGPYFEGELGDAADGSIQVSAHVGSEALLNCRVGMLKDKTVMWLRRTTDSAQLLTVGPAPYAGDNRISVKFQYPNNWRLSVNPVKRGDAGLYMCQISTHPPRAILANLTVLPPVLTINNDETHNVKDRFYKAGSSIKLTCSVSSDYITKLPRKSPTTTQAPTTLPTTEATTKISTPSKIDFVANKSWSVETTVTSTSSTSELPLEVSTLRLSTATTVSPIEDNIYGLFWRKQGKALTEGVTMRNESSIFKVESASQNDSGTYTCHLQNHSRVIVNVHVLIGENQAAVHHDTWNKGTLYWSQSALAIPLLLFIIN